jgi:toxin ParE1/3/4
MRLSYHPEAEAELLEATRYYRRQVHHLGVEFKEAAEAAVRSISQAPTRYPFIDRDIRRCRMRRFPYAIHYRILGDRLRLLAIKHFKRHPDHGRDRV